MKINVAVIGCGGISAVHLKYLMDRDFIHIVSVCDINEERAKAKAEQAHCEYTLDWHDYLTDERIQVVHICTPHYLHAPMAIALLNAGKRVLTEKPMASTLPDARRMIAAADGRLAVIFQNRYNDSSVLIKQAIEDGRYGKLRGMRASVFWHREPPYYVESGWRGAFKTEGGGVMINQSIHTLDLLLYFGGRPVSVRGAVSTDKLYGTIEVEDTAHCFIRFENGVTASFYATNTYIEDMPVELEAIFEKATLHLYAETLLKVQDGKTELLAQSAATGDKAYWGTSHERELDDFYTCVQNNKPFWLDGRSAYTALKVLKSVYRSSAEGATVIL